MANTKVLFLGVSFLDSHWESNAQGRDNLNYIVRFISAFKFSDSDVSIGQGNV